MTGPDGSEWVLSANGKECEKVADGGRAAAQQQQQSSSSSRVVKVVKEGEHIVPEPQFVPDAAAIDVSIRQQLKDEWASDLTKQVCTSSYCPPF